MTLLYIILLITLTHAYVAKQPLQFEEEMQDLKATLKHKTFVKHTHKLFPLMTLRSHQESKLCDPDVKQIVGYLDVEHKEHTDHYFFWFFESRSSPSTDPLILWLNGGPGFLF